MPTCPVVTRSLAPMLMTSLLAALAASTYLAAAVRIARHVAHPPAEGPVRDTFACAAVYCGVVLHALALWPALALWGGPGPGLPATISIAGLALAAVFAVALLWRMDHVVGALVLPIAAIAPLVPVAWPDQPVPAGTATAPMHAVISILTYAVLGLAALQALILAWQEHRIRTKRPGGALGTMASLDTQERWLFRLVGVGFFLLSLSLASGFMFVSDMLAQHLAHKTVLSCTAWLIFGALLWGRRRYGWRGQTAVRWCLGGFAVLVLAYFGSRWILEVLLERRWYSA